ncbi:MAG TPA: hypothetical protein VF613_17710 [Longimicrobium sp.]|jgi:hypothetical protein
MDVEQRRWLQKSLAERLQAESLELTLDQRGRVSWLTAHLVEYVERWCGFINQGVPADSLLARNLSEMVDIGAE